MTDQKDTTVPAVEVIGFQKADFFLALISTVEKYRPMLRSKTSSEEYKQASSNFCAEIAGAIAVHVGITALVSVEENSAVSANAFMPHLTAGNPHSGVSAQNAKQLQILSKFVEQNASRAAVEGVINGWISNSTSKVGGDFSKIPTYVKIFTGLLKAEAFTDRMIAAVIVHEVGHLYNQFAAMVESVRLAYELSDAYLKLMNADRKEYKAILDYSDKKLGFNDKAGTMVASQAADGMAVFTVYSAQCFANLFRKNLDPLKNHGQPSFEFSADAFAIRHGAYKEMLQVRVQYSINTYRYNNMYTLFALAQISSITAIKFFFKRFVGGAAVAVLGPVVSGPVMLLMDIMLSRLLATTIGTPLSVLTRGASVRVNSKTDHAEQLKQQLAELAKDKILDKEQLADATEALAYANDIINNDDFKQPMIITFFDSILNRSMNATAIKDYSNNIANLLSNELFLKAQELK